MCDTLNLEYPSKTSMSRKSYNEAVKKACQWWDEANMKKEMERMENKKMRTMIHENLDLKEYVRNGPLVSARKTWQIRCYMLDVAGRAQRVGFFNIGSGRVGYWTKYRLAGRVRVG